MTQLYEDYRLGEFETSPVTIREALDIQEESWYQVIDSREFRVPEYQRNYSWEASNRSDFWNTLNDSFTELAPLPDDLEDRDELAGLYMGAVYIAEPGEESEYDKLDIVDGQQRFATFQLLLKALYDYCKSLETEAGDEGEIDLESSLTNVKVQLGKAFSGTDPSVTLNSEDRDYFTALAAYPENWHTSVRDILLEKIANNDGVTHNMYPRARKVSEIIDKIQDPIPGVRRINLKEIDAFAGSHEDDDADNKLDEWIRYETSHERLFKAYKESYGFIEELHDDLTNGDLTQRANVTMNFAAYILHAITVDRCLITEPNPDLRLDIFQSINDKGKELHNVDKIRARIKHRLVGEDDAGTMDEWRDTLARFDGDKDDIEQMLKYFVAAIEDSVNDVTDAGKAVMQVFDRSTSDDSDITPRLTKDGATGLVSRVAEYSKYYTDIRDAELSHFDRAIDDDNRKEVKRMLDRVGNRIGATQWYALAPYVYMQLDEEAPDSYEEDDIGDFLYNVVDAIEVLTLRQSVSDRSGEAIEGVYVTTVQEFADRNGDSKFDSSKLVSDLVDATSNKAEDLFEDGLIYHMVKNRAWTSGELAQCIFQRATSRYLQEEVDPGRDIRDYSEVQIEHILPQTPISDTANRTAAADDPGAYAWLEYFFRTDATDEDSDITASVQTLIDEDVPSLKNGDLDSDALSDDVDIDEIETIQDEIDKRFIDDIGNLLFLLDADNLDASNDLLSKKLPIYTKDDYLAVVVNDFFNGGEDSAFAASSHIEMRPEDFETLEDDSSDWDNDAAERVDRSWTYEGMFERKASMVYEILQRLTFNLKPADDDEGDEGESTEIDTNEFEGLEDRVEEAVRSDRERRINRRNF